LFTKYGFHLNELGKELLSNKLVSLILSILNKDRGNPISLGWHGKNLQIKDPLIIKSRQVGKEQRPTRTRKAPITRNDDFLWER
jgi:hypothetical protein